ncbi:helix-hairpin-helix domain-containing protein, partial [Candidatus Thioglobus sp.]|uniref:helix-hairpin-helix domain-containing protein n=1 Tax=Candidatus Thioglobus sp. TaxID=2026721 RepID=UPI0026158C42
APIDIPEKCPSCGAKLKWESDFLMCVNHDLCPAQVIGKLEYFFKILANNDGFGIATIEKLYKHGMRKVSQIYALNIDDFRAMGFGDKTSINLVNQLQRSINEQIEDWRFLAAFGVARLGMGNCENLLKSHTLDAIFSLNIGQISAIDGFAELTAKMIVNGLKSIKLEYDLLSQYRFNLESTILNKDLKGVKHSLNGKKIVFTGVMSGSREEMKKHAKSIGIVVAGSVSSKTDYLVTGSNVGSKKIQSAVDFGVQVITELEYIKMIS